MKRFKKIICFLLPACLLTSFAACSQSPKMGERLAEPTNLSAPQRRDREEKQGDIFVSPTGDDANPGTAESPVRTPQRAVKLARSLNQGEKVISLADGEYNISALFLTVGSHSSRRILSRMRGISWS